MPRPPLLDDARIGVWLSQLPAGTRKRIRGRLRSEERRFWLPALAELFWMRHAARSGWAFKPEAATPSGHTPELLATRPAHFYLEVKTGFDEIEVEIQNRTIFNLIAELDKALVGPWRMRLREPFPLRYASETAAARARATLAEDPDANLIVCDDEGMVTLERMRHGGNGVMTSSFLARWLPVEQRITASLHEKASQYGSSRLGDVAYVIALFGGDEYVVGLDGLADVLYGPAGHTVLIDEHAEPRGLVAAPRSGGWFNRPDVVHVSAVAFTRTQALDPLDAESWVFHNPRARFPIPVGAFAPLPEVSGHQRAERLEWTSPSDARMRLIE
jgi:hypothetical protein